MSDPDNSILPHFIGLSFSIKQNAIEFVDAEGNSYTIDESDSRFHGLVIGLGLTGVVTHYWLHIEPTFDIRQVIFENLSDFELEKSFDQIMSSAYSVSFFTDWSETHRGNLWCKFKANEEIPQKIADAQPATFKLHPITIIDPAAANGSPVLSPVPAPLSAGHRAVR